MPPVTGRNFQGESKKLSSNANMFAHRERFTVAQINAGATLLSAVPNYKYRITDMTLIAVGGAATVATAVTILGTRAAASVALLTAAIAALTQSAILRAGAANAVVLADGASHTDLDVNTAITVGKTGGTLAGATHIDVIVTYVLERV